MKYGIIITIAIILSINISLCKKRKVKNPNLNPKSEDHKLYYANGEEVKFTELYKVAGSTSINIDGNKMNIGKENDPENKQNANESSMPQGSSNGSSMPQASSNGSSMPQGSSNGSSMSQGSSNGK